MNGYWRILVSTFPIECADSPRAIFRLAWEPEMVKNSLAPYWGRHSGHCAYMRISSAHADHVKEIHTQSAQTGRRVTEQDPAHAHVF